MTSDCICSINSCSWVAVRVVESIVLTDVVDDILLLLLFGDADVVVDDLEEERRERPASRLSPPGDD